MDSSRRYRNANCYKSHFALDLLVEPFHACDVFLKSWGLVDYSCWGVCCSGSATCALRLEEWREHTRLDGKVHILEVECAVNFDKSTPPLMTNFRYGIRFVNNHRDALRYSVEDYSGHLDGRVATKSNGKPATGVINPGEVKRIGFPSIGMNSPAGPIYEGKLEFNVVVTTVNGGRTAAMLRQYKPFVATASAPTVTMECVEIDLEPKESKAAA